MTQVSTMDSNITGLRVAEEASLGVLPGTPEWVQLEPNSYSDFGGQLKTVARTPINDSRQRKKGVVVDLDASGGYNSDLTQTNMQSLLQGFMFADFREKFDTDPFNGTPIAITAVTTGPNEYVAASGLDEVQAGALIFTSGFDDADNNGLKLATAADATAITVSETLIADASPAAGAALTEVGFQFGTTEVSLSVAASLPRLVRAGAVAADGVYTLAGNVSDGDTVTIGDRTYTFQSALSTGPTIPDEVFIGVSASASLDNLIAAINGAGGVGTTYSTGTAAHEDVTAAAGTGDTMDVTAAVAGATGNLIATTEVGANSSWGAATLTGGSGATMTDFGLTPGEFVFMGGDAVGTQFANAANNGFKRVKRITADYIEFDKSDLAMVADAGTGKTIRLFFGRQLKNETGTLVKRRSYQFERTLGAPDDAQPLQVQSEYLVGSIGNKFKINMKTADKITCDLEFVSMDNEQRTGAQGLKGGTRPTVVESDAYNTTSNVVGIRLSEVTPGNEAPAPLFAFATEFNLDIDNNVTPNKAIGTLGAIGVTAGTFTVGGNLTCYFSNVEAVQAVRNNADITFDFHMFKANAGISFDMPLITLGGGRATIEQDKPILLPLENAAATGAKIDTEMNHTLSLVFYPYLPDLADA